MHVPINSFKFFGIELDIYKHSQNPSSDCNLEDYYLDGYLEVVFTFTLDNFFVNPREYRILIVSPIDGRQLFAQEGNVFALTLAPFEEFFGIRHHIDYSFQAEGCVGADFLDIYTKPAHAPLRQEQVTAPHDKGLVVPKSMLFN